MNVKSVREGMKYYTGRKISASHPLNLLHFAPATEKNILKIVRDICHKFETLIEDNGLADNLYKESGKRLNERYAQRLFYAVADSYCEANNLDLSREPTAGRGPVDFKISQGYTKKVLVEVKYSTNPNLVKGFTKQLPIYNRAENTDESIYLVLQMTDNDNSIKKLEETRANYVKKKKEHQKLYILMGGSNHPRAKLKIQNDLFIEYF